MIEMMKGSVGSVDEHSLLVICPQTGITGCLPLNDPEHPVSFTSKFFLLFQGW